MKLPPTRRGLTSVTFTHSSESGTHGSAWHHPVPSACPASPSRSAPHGEGTAASPDAAVAPRTGAVAAFAGARHQNRDEPVRRRARPAQALQRRTARAAGAVCGRSPPCPPLVRHMAGAGHGGGHAEGRPPPMGSGRPSDCSLTGCTDRSRSPPAERPGRSPCRTASSRCRRSRRPSTSRPWPPRSAPPGCCGSGTGPYRPG